jgi:antitoxin YefM
MSLKTTMKMLTASEARSNLYRLIDETAVSHQPVVISGKRSQAVLLAADDWKAIQETLYLLSIPAMRESIRKGLKKRVGKCSKNTGGDMAGK